MNIQPMIDELLLIRRGLGGVGYNQGTFGSKREAHPCGTVCCMAGIARFKEVGKRYLKDSDEERIEAGARMLGITPNRIQYPVPPPIFSSGARWPHLVWQMLCETKDEKHSIDAAICALRLMDDNGGFYFRGQPVSTYKQKKVIKQRLAEVAAEEQELSELGKLLKEVELELNRPETDRKLLRKDKDLAKKAVSKSIRASGRKLVATQDRPK